MPGAASSQGFAATGPLGLRGPPRIPARAPAEPRASAVGSRGHAFRLVFVGFWSETARALAGSEVRFWFSGPEGPLVVWFLVKIL